MKDTEEKTESLQEPEVMEDIRRIRVYELLYKDSYELRDTDAARTGPTKFYTRTSAYIS